MNFFSFTYIENFKSIHLTTKSMKTLFMQLLCYIYNDISESELESAKCKYKQRNVSYLQYLLCTFNANGKFPERCLFYLPK